MNIIPRMDRRLTTVTAGIVVVLVGGLLVAVASDGRASNDPVLPDPVPSSNPVPTPAGTDNSNKPDKPDKDQALTASQVAFHDDFRKLWEDHVTWTRLVIVNFAADAPGYPASANRLLENQTDIGDAIKPYYGEQAGADLTLLLNDHIAIAGEILEAAKYGTDAELQNALAEWYSNADQIADHLAALNPDNWSQEELRAEMKAHLNLTFAEATAELRGEYDASVNAYEEVHLHILTMADTLSSGIIKQFPDQFAG